MEMNEGRKNKEEERGKREKEKKYTASKPRLRKKKHKGITPLSPLSRWMEMNEGEKNKEAGKEGHTNNTH